MSVVIINLFALCIKRKPKLIFNENTHSGLVYKYSFTTDAACLWLTNSYITVAMISCSASLLEGH